jgi:hypothetical protein
MLNGAGVPSMQAKWEEMFGVKEEEEREKKGPKEKKPAKKRATKKLSEKEKETSGQKNFRK